MSNGRVAGFVVGFAAVVAAGGALAYVLAKEERREQALRLYGEYAPKGQAAVKGAAERAREVGEKVAQSAGQYSAQLPKAREAVNAALAQAPQRFEQITAALPFGQNGKAPVAITDHAE